MEENTVTWTTAESTSIEQVFFHGTSLFSAVGGRLWNLSRHFSANSQVGHFKFVFARECSYDKYLLGSPDAALNLITFCNNLCLSSSCADIKMPRVCCIKTCFYSKGKNCRNIKLPFFRLPRDPTMQEKWLSIADGKMRKRQTTPKIIYFCEKHFEESDIIRSFDVVIGNIRDTIPSNLVKLKSSAVPRIFHNSLPGKDDIKRNLSKKNGTSETVNKNRNTQPTISNSLPSRQDDNRLSLGERTDTSETIHKNRNPLPANYFTGLLSCCIPNCKNYNSKKRTKTKRVKYFTFPKDKTVLNAWLNACQKNLEDIKVKAAWICEEHFSDDCFHYVLSKLHVEGKTPRRVKKLKHGSIPTLNLNLPKLLRFTISEAPKTNSEDNSEDQNLCSQKREQFRCESPDDFHPSKFLEVIIRDSTSRSPEKSNNVVLKKEAGSLERREELVLKSCFLCGGKQNIGMQPAVAMYTFPDDSHVNRAWRQACNLLEHDYMNTSALLVCSKHFMAEDYTCNSTDGSQLLKPNAVPSILVPNPVNAASSIDLNPQESGDDDSQIPNVVPSVSVPNPVNASQSLVELNPQESRDVFNDTQSFELVSKIDALKERDVHCVDNSSQTQASIQFVNRSCQTEPVCIVDYKDMDLHVTAHPMKRKRRLSFP